MFGIVWSPAEEKMLIGGVTRAIILTGFMGSFTMFSTYIFKTSELLRDDQLLLAFSNIAGQIVFCLICFFIELAFDEISKYTIRGDLR